MEQQDITWNHNLEKLLAEEGEQSLGNAWLHSQSEEVFSFSNSCLVIPVIVLSTLTGAMSASSTAFFPGSLGLVSLAIGGSSILCGILNTINGYYGYAKRTEGHRIAAISFNKIYHFIANEMALPRVERIRAHDMLKIVREQIERLAETSPRIPASIVKRFRRQFPPMLHSNIAMPDIIIGLKAIGVNSARNPVHTPSPQPVAQTAADKNRLTIVVPPNPFLGNITPVAPETGAR